MADRLEGGAIGDASAELAERLARLVREAVDLSAELQRGSRFCAACGSLLMRKPYETPRSFAARRSCNQVCAGVVRSATLAAKRAAANAAAPVEVKVCPQCRREFARRVRSGAGYETPREFALRRFCSRGCSTAWQHAHRGEPRPRVTRPRARPPRPAVASREARPLPDPGFLKPALVVGPPAPIVGSATVAGRTFDASICEAHHQQRGWFGCPACNASAAHRAAVRSRPFRPHPEGGR